MSETKRLNAKPFTKWWYTILKAQCGFICSSAEDFDDDVYKRYEKLRAFIIKRRRLAKDD